MPDIISNDTMMTEHILLELAVRQPHQLDPQLPGGATYSFRNGYWVIGDDALVNSPDFRKRPPVSKKMEFETGEDIKGQ